MNLARCGVTVEIRMVLHHETIDRLPQFARFIARNLPFVDHLAVLGLEMMGFVRMNLDFLWADPADYQSQLKQAVVHLQQHGINVSIYNHQLCVLDGELWPIATRASQIGRTSTGTSAMVAQCSIGVEDSSLRPQLRHWIVSIGFTPKCFRSECRLIPTPSLTN